MTATDVFFRVLVSAALMALLASPACAQAKAPAKPKGRQQAKAGAMQPAKPAAQQAPVVKPPVVGKQRLALLQQIYQQRQVLLGKKEVLDSKILTLRNQVETIEAEASEVAGEASAIQASIASLHANIRDLRDQKNRATDRLDIASYDKAIEQRNAEGRSLENQYRSLTSDVARIMSRVSSLSGQAADAQRATDDLYAQADQLRAEWLRLVDPFGRLARKEHEAAILTFTEWTVLDGGNAEAFLARGFAYWRLGELEKALEDFARAAEIGDTVRSTAFAARGGVQFVLNRQQQAAADFAQAFKLDKTNALAYLLRGQTKNIQRKYALAASDYAAAIRLNKQDYEAHLHLAFLQATCPVASVRHGKKAVAGAKAACEMTSWKYWYALDVLAAAHAEAGDFAEAIKYAKLAAELAVDEDAQTCRDHLVLYQADKPLRL